MYLVDTNVVSELRRRAHAAEPTVRKWAMSVPPESQFLSGVTIGEIEEGVLRKERDDPRQGAVLRQWLENVILREFADRILPVDADVARRMAQFGIARTRQMPDAYIGATAAVHGLILVTRNTKDFGDLGIGLLNPWQYGG